jgi:hypothetical protein
MSTKTGPALVFSWTSDLIESSRNLIKPDIEFD